MPTGYTSDLYNGDDVTLEQFIKTCARGFVADMRDSTGEIQLVVEPKDDYHEKELVKAYTMRAKVESMNTTQLGAAARKEQRKQKKHYEEAIAKNDTLLQRYEDMLAQARAWTPPSPDHQGLKDLMIEQLETSIKFDCGSGYLRAELDKYREPLSPTAYKQKMLAQADRDIEYHTEQLIKAKARITQRNEWVGKLLGGLNELAPSE